MHSLCCCMCVALCARVALGFCRFARIIAFYEELFEEDGSLKAASVVFSRALSRFMKSCLKRTVRLKRLLSFFRAHYRIL